MIKKKSQGDAGQIRSALLYRQGIHRARGTYFHKKGFLQIFKGYFLSEVSYNNSPLLCIMISGEGQ
jgi:hypothetical protein